LELLWELRGVNDTSAIYAWQWVPPQELDPAALEAARDALIARWIQCYPEPALAWLASRAGDDARAAARLYTMAQRSPQGVRRVLSETLGPVAAEALAQALELPAGLTEEAILALLDEGAQALWPIFNMMVDDRCEYLGLRMIA